MKFDMLLKVKDIVNVPKFSREFFETDLYAVRSDDSKEDGETKTMAGMFKTKLFVKKDDLEESIKEVLKSANNYFLQEMIKAEYSGVIFSDGQKQIISCARGYCEGITSGKIITDNFCLKEWEVISKNVFSIEDKQYIADNLEMKQEYEQVDYDFNLIIGLGKVLESFLKMPIDIEWSVKDGKIYCLQVRRLTFKL